MTISENDIWVCPKYCNFDDDIVREGGIWAQSGNQSRCIDTYFVVCACMRMHPSIHTSMHASMHPCIHAYMHVCMYAYMHTCIHAYTHTRIHAYTHTCSIHAYTHTCIHAYMHACMHACMHIFIYIYIHKITQTQTFPLYKLIVIVIVILLYCVGLHGSKL